MATGSILLTVVDPEHFYHVGSGNGSIPLSYLKKNTQNFTDFVVKNKITVHAYRYFLRKSSKCFEIYVWLEE
jgi:hypothetical protein